MSMFYRLSMIMRPIVNAAKYVQCALLFVKEMSALLRSPLPLGN